MKFSIDPARLRAFDHAYAAACAAESAANATNRELIMERRALVNEIERKAKKEVREHDDDFLTKALSKGFATREIIAKIKKLDIDIAATRDTARAASEHRLKLNDAVHSVRMHVGRPA